MAHWSAAETAAYTAVRKEWPENLPISIRLGVRDFHSDEQPLEESIELIRRFKAAGLDLIDVTLGFNSGYEDGPKANVPWGENAFLAETAGTIREQVDIPTATSWNIRDPQLADRIERPQEKLPLQYSVWLHGHDVIAAQ